MDDKPEGLVRQFHRGLLVLPNCAGCPLEGDKQIHPEGDPTAHVAIVGEAPSYYDGLHDRVFSGTAGRFLDIMLANAGAERSEFWFTNTILCRPKSITEANGNVINPEQVARKAATFCRPRLQGELSVVKPRMVIGFGSESVRALYEPTETIKGRRGGVHRINLAAQLGSGEAK